MSKWKKFMAAALALSMTVPSCLLQTMWAAELSDENGNVVTESFEDERTDASENSTIDESEEIAPFREETWESSDVEASEITGDDAFGDGETEITEDNNSAEEAEPNETFGENPGEEDELELSDVPEMAGAGETADCCTVQLYSNGKLEKTYTVAYTAMDSAKAPAELKRSGYTFKEWNTRADGKGTAYKPGASIKKLIEASKPENKTNQDMDAGEVVQDEAEQAATDAEFSTNAVEPADIQSSEQETSVQNVTDAEIAENTVQQQADVQNDEQESVAPTKSDAEFSTDIVEQAQTTDAIDASEAPSIDQGEAAEVQASDSETPTVTLYAIWTKNAAYKITYKLNGGKNNAANPKTYTIESKITLKSPTRSGYHFVGWYRDSKFQKKITIIEKGSKGNLTVYARWTPQVNASSKAATLTSLRGLNVGTIVATVTVPKYVKSYDSYYYLVYVDSNTGKVKKAAAKVTKPQSSNRKLTIKLSTAKHPEYAQGKFAIAVKKSKSAWTLISAKSYVSSPENIAANKKSYFLPKTKKGIQTTNINEVTDTKSKTVFINIFASDVMSGYETYTYNGKKYYFGGLYGIQNFVSSCNAKGIQVTAQINLNKSYNTQSLLTGNSPYSDTAYYGFNTSKSSSRQTMEAMFAYLGEKFGRNNCYVSNWILGNEINSASHYYYLGNVSFSKYMSMYSEAFRCLYNAVRSNRASSKVFICLDNCWRQKNIFSVCYTSKSTLDTFAATVKKLQKGVNWNLAYHAYSQPLTESQFWSSVNAPLLTNDGNTATFITMHNIQALTSYVKNKFGSGTRIILSEQGYSSSFGGQANQAANMALAYYKAACNPMIDAFIIRSYQDEAHEVAQGLALGLKDANGKKKTVYNVFRNMDSTFSEKYTKNVLNSKVGNWKSKVPGYSVKRVSSMYRAQ